MISIKKIYEMISQNEKLKAILIELVQKYDNGEISAEDVIDALICEL